MIKMSRAACIHALVFQNDVISAALTVPHMQAYSITCSHPRVSGLTLACLFL